MIKIGRVKLHVNISDFLTQDNHSMVLQSEHEDQNDEEQLSKHMIFPFIQYLEGSYFGDSDSLVSGAKILERDATAVADEKCQFFVVQRDFILSLKRLFGKEIKGMEQLARKRRHRH